MATVLSYVGGKCFIRKRCLSFQGRDIYVCLQDLTYTVLQHLSQQSKNHSHGKLIFCLCIDDKIYLIW
jgi:hypothetical protein